MSKINFIIDVENGVCRIIDGYQTTSREEMTAFVKEYLSSAPFNRRSVKSYVREWRTHNMLYEMHIMVSHTKDTDLDVNESWIRRIGYFFLSPFYRGK